MPHRDRYLFEGVSPIDDRRDLAILKVWPQGLEVRMTLLGGEHRQALTHEHGQRLGAGAVDRILP